MKKNKKSEQISIPSQLPFLEAVCWHLDNVYGFTPEEMLSGYERGWKYRQLFDLEGEEREFVKQIATIYNSWLITEL